MSNRSRRPPAPTSCVRCRITRRYTQARRRLGADRGGRHARAVHGQRRGGRAAVPQGQGAGLAHRRIRHAAARDQHAHAARGRRGQAVGAHAGDPAADRPQPARRRRSRSARRAHDQDRLRRAAGRRRHALRVDHRRVRRGRRRGRVVPARAASSPASRCAIMVAAVSVGIVDGVPCSTSTTPRTRAATPT